MALVTWSAPLPLFHCSSEIAPSRSTSCRSAHPQNSPNQGRVAKVGLRFAGSACFGAAVKHLSCSRSIYVHCRDRLRAGGKRIRTFGRGGTTRPLDSPVEERASN